MENVKVHRVELLEVLKTNRAAHRSIFDQACVGYRDAVVTKLDEMLADAKAGRRIQQAVGLVEPMDQTKEYDRAIKMLEMSVDEVIELTGADFSQYVMDDWRWKDQFTRSTALYAK